jgi:integrase
MPVMARKAWPPFRTKRAQAIARKQHEKLIETEQDSEFRHYLEMLWETGGSQTDIAGLHRNNVDEERHCLTYNRKKMGNQKEQEGAAITIGNSLEQLLAKLPKEGLLFPKLAQQNEKVRASRFRKCCDRLGFTNISLHSYRYAWAERAKTAGMPLREAMAHLGHGSKAIHHAYSASAQVITLPLEYYEAAKRRKDEEFRKQTFDLNSPEGI